MTMLKLSDDGFEKLNQAIDDIENLSGEGMLNPNQAVEFCRKIYLATHTVRRTLWDVTLVTPHADGPGGPKAA
jgi:hypothetical protein